MELWPVAALAAVSFAVSLVGVITGGHSMVTVPLMMFLGMPPAEAVATNRFANFFLAAAGSTNYARHGKINLRFLWPLLLATLAGASAGALLLLLTPGADIRRLIGLFMISIVVFGILQPKAGLEDCQSFQFSTAKRVSGLTVSALMGAYWGFFGGGGMTLYIFFLTAVFRFSFLQSVGASNVAMACASFVSIIIYACYGRIDLTVGAAMAVAMAAGAWVGSACSIKIGNVWVRRVFNAVIILFAIKLILEIG